MLVAQLLRLGAFGRLGAAVRKTVRATRGCIGCSAFRPCTPASRLNRALALYAVITYMDSIEGVWFPEGGMHAVPMIMAQAAEKAGVTLPLRRRGEEVLRSPTGRVAGVRTASGRADHAPTPWSALSTCRPRTSTCCRIFARRERPDAASTRPRRWSGMSAYAGAGTRRSPTTTSTSATEWGTAFDALLKRGELMPDPSRLVTIPSLDDSDAGTRRLLHAVRPGARAQPATA